MPAAWTGVGGIPVPAGTLFVAGAGAVATRAARNRRRLQQTLRPVTAALFFAYGFPLLLTPFAPAVRLVFFVVIIGSLVALYE